MRVPFIIPLCFFAFLVNAFAERSAQVVLFKPPENAPNSIFLHSGIETPFEIDLPRHNFSNSFSLPKGDLRLRFLVSALPEDEKMPVEAPSVQIPAAWKKVLLLSFSDPNNKILPLRFKAINATENVFGDGQTLIINFTKVTVTGTFGNKKLTLQPKKRLIVGDVSGGKTSFKVRLDSAAVGEKGKGQVPLIRQIWRHYPASRQLVYIYKLNGGQITYQSFPINNL